MPKADIGAFKGRNNRQRTVGGGGSIKMVEEDNYNSTGALIIPYYDGESYSDDDGLLDSPELSPRREVKTEQV